MIIFQYILHANHQIYQTKKFRIKIHKGKINAILRRNSLEYNSAKLVMNISWQDLK